MRLRILQDTYTVGEFLEAGKMADVQEPLAKSLIAQGKAAEAFPGMTQTTEKVVNAPVMPAPMVFPEAVPSMSSSMLGMPAPVTGQAGVANAPVKPVAPKPAKEKKPAYKKAVPKKSSKR